MTSSDQRMQDISKTLVTGVREFFSSEKYASNLKIMSQFHNYSYRNCLLIAMQKPEASYVAGFTTWKKLGRNVKQGEHAIKILAPAPKKLSKEKIELDESGTEIKTQVNYTINAFRPANAFDISQTEGAELPLGLKQLQGQVNNYDLMMDCIKEVSPYPVDFGNTGRANGYCNISDKRIVIKENMSELQTIKTALHEVSHARMHTGENVDALTRRTIEVEAESVAFIVCNHYSLDTSDYSFEYVASWSFCKDVPELQQSIERIHAGAKSLICELDEMQLQLEQQFEHTVGDSFIEDLDMEIC